MKFSANDRKDICEVSFSRIMKFPNEDVMAAIFALFLQNLWGGRKLSSAVCHLKSARLVGNFCQYVEPRFRKKLKTAAKNKIFETIQVRCLFRLKLTC